MLADVRIRCWRATRLIASAPVTHYAVGMWRPLLCLPALLVVFSSAAPWAAAQEAPSADAIRAIAFTRLPYWSASSNATVEVHPSPAGWLVIYRDVDVPCSSIPGVGPCTDLTYRDVYECVDPLGQIVGQLGALPESLGEDPCPPDPPLAAGALTAASSDAELALPDA
ncbi:MAG: hypothetical protein QOF51_1390, partial [Chloroflexota bacterium]|nr:hypothetical protein [Chloroflexota bacterium]